MNDEEIEEFVLLIVSFVLCSLIVVPVVITIFFIIFALAAAM